LDFTVIEGDLVVLIVVISVAHVHPVLGAEDVTETCIGDVRPILIPGLPEPLQVLGVFQRIAGLEVGVRQIEPETLNQVLPKR
jgi:hypothetical protein